MYEDLDKFPSGMKALGDWIKAQVVPAIGANVVPATGANMQPDWIKEQVVPTAGTNMRYGLYSCRGTCQCGTGTYSAPGSHGYEAADVDWMVAAGAQYLKIDSCCGSQVSLTRALEEARCLVILCLPSLPSSFPIPIHRTTPPPSPTTPSSATR